MEDALRSAVETSSPPTEPSAPAERATYPLGHEERESSGHESKGEAARELNGGAPGPLLTALLAQVEVSRRALALVGDPALATPLSGDVASDCGKLAQAIVASVADGCMIDALDPEGIEPLAVAHVDASREPALRDVARRDLSRIWESALLRLPLCAGDEALGVLTIWSEQGRALAPAELSVVHWVARLLSALLDNRRLMRSATEARKATDSLLSMVSHELRTPLATISMSLDTSMRRIHGSADELPRRWLIARLEKAKRAVVRTDRLIHTFLGVSMIQMGRLTPEVQDVDATQIVSGVVSSLADDLSWAGCRWSLHAPRPERGRWDPIQLEIAVTNLLTNAIKYAPGSAVEIRLEGSEQALTISVQDHGPGIPLEQQTRLFQRFSRLPTGSRVHGFGLGLWIVKHFVEANGGRVELVSAPGRGTRFSLHLPRAA